MFPLPPTPPHTHSLTHTHCCCVLVKMIYNFQKFSFAFAIHTQANCLCAFCLFTASSRFPSHPRFFFLSSFSSFSSYSQASCLPIARVVGRAAATFATLCRLRKFPSGNVKQMLPLSLQPCAVQHVAQRCLCCATRCRHVAAESVSRQTRRLVRSVYAFSATAKGLFNT